MKNNDPANIKVPNKLINICFSIYKYLFKFISDLPRGKKTLVHALKPTSNFSYANE